MKDAVKLLLDKAKNIQEGANNVYKYQKERLDAELSARLAEAAGLVKAAQSICEHKGEIREEHDFDYHKREESTRVYCVECGALIKHV